MGYVQHAASTAAGGSAVFGSALTVGNLVAVGIAITGSNHTVTSVSDDKGNVYTQVPGAYKNATDGGGAAMDMWVCKNVTVAGATTLNCVLSAGSAYISAWESSGRDQYDPVDSVSSRWFNGGSTTITGPAHVTNNPDTFVVAMGCTPSGGGNCTGLVAGAFTSDGVANNFLGSAHLNSSAISTYTPAWTQAISGETLAIVVSFRIASTQPQAKFVQSAGIYPGTSKAYPSNNTLGNFLFAAVSFTGGASGTTITTATPTISDTLGNTWTPLGVFRSTSPINTNVSVAIRLYYCENCQAGANTVSIANIGSDTDYGLEIYEFANLRLSSSIDGSQVTTQSPNSTTTTPTSNSIVLSSPAALLMLAYANETAAQGTFTAPSGFHLGQNDTGHADAQVYQLNTPAGTYTPSIQQGSATKDWILVAVAFMAQVPANPKPGAGALTATGFAPTVTIASAGTNVNTGLGVVTLTGFAPDVGPRPLPGAGVVSLTGFAPTAAVSNNQNVAVGLGTPTLAGYAPDVGPRPLPGAGAVSLTGLAPTVSLSDNKNVLTGCGLLSLTGVVPDITQRALPGCGVLSLSAFVPTVSISDNQNALAGCGVVTLAGFRPDLTQNVQPGCGLPSLTGFAPAWSTSNNQFAFPGCGALLFAGFGPDITEQLQPGAGLLSCTGFAPVVVGGQNQTVTPGAGILTIVGLTPVWSASDNQFAAPGCALLALAGLAPTIQLSDNKNVVPDVGLPTLTGWAPQALSSANRIMQPGTGQLVLAGYPVDTTPHYLLDILVAGGPLYPLHAIGGARWPAQQIGANLFTFQARAAVLYRTAGVNAPLYQTTTVSDTT